MIPFDFIYCRPDTLTEAAEAFCQLTKEGKDVRYYSGGSETITLCRAGSIRPGAVIDLKRIPELTALYVDGQGLHIGGACTLSRIKESKFFPLLALACGRIADHTNQCRITLGGNLCATIIYREASLPLMLADADITLFGPNGARTVPLQSVFDGRMHLNPGELIVQAHVPAWALGARHAHIKKTTNEKIDYPLVNVTALWKDECLRTASSGVCSAPFRSARIEDILNDRALSCDVRAEKAAQSLPYPPRDDVEGSGQYRAFVLKNTLRTLLEAWENGEI